MKIAVDIQALQSKNSRNRGIGRYTQAVIEALYNQQNTFNYELYANSTLPEPMLSKSIFSYSSVYYPYVGSSAINELLLKTTLISSDADLVFLPSPMEDLESTIPDYTDFSKKVFVICYDLIPLIFADRYLIDINTKSLYKSRLKNIQNADFIFAISESTRQDLIKYLNISPNKVLNVSGGVSSFFTPIKFSDHPFWLKKFADKFGINKKFILYTGGEDWRKNIEGLVTAFSKLPKSLYEDYQLVVACKISEFFTNEIRKLATRLGVGKSLILTNYITDEELRALYSTCSLFVFPSFYEGFGLPLLEAMSCGAPAIASNNSSLPEILGSETQIFDPYSPDDMARVMQKVLSDNEFRTKISENALKQAAKFSWDSVGKKMVDVFREHQPINKVTVVFSRVKTESEKPKFAFFSPFPPAKSGIADYSQDLIPSLQQYCNLDLYEDGYLLEADVVNQIFPHTEFEERLESQGYEGIIYQLGNSSYHCNMFSKLMRYSGISVLHDYYLGGLINYMDTQYPELGIKLSKELEHCYGKDKGTEILKLIKQGELNIHEKLPEEKIYLNRRVFTCSTGVILHSKWAYNRAVKDFNDDNHNIIHIPQLVPKFVFKEKLLTAERQSLGIPDDSLIVAAFGFISSTKRPLQILHAFKKYVINHPKAYLVFVGGTDYVGSINIEHEIEKLGLKDQVKITGYVSMSDFYNYIEISDICLNLRYPFNGESSASLLRILSVGKATVVTDIGSFADFPDDVVHKIPQPHHSNEVNEIVKALILLTENGEYRHLLSRNSSEYIAKEHSPERCARLYSDFIQQVLKSLQAKQKLLTDYVGRELAKLETSVSDSILAYFAKPISLNDAEQQQIEKDIDFISSVEPTLQPPVNIELNKLLHECRSICLAKIPQANNILSIGCSGTWYFDWFDKFYPYSVENHTGIDLNPKPANLPDNVTWIQHDGQNLSMLQSESFDLVFAGQFIEHISWEAQVSFLLEVNRTLKSEGIFVVDSPNYTLTNRYGWKQPEHIHEITFGQACELLQIAGFEIQESYGILPKNLLGQPPELFDRYLQSSFAVSFIQADIQNAIYQDPNDCFIWWIVAKKPQAINVNHTQEALRSKLEHFYAENQKIKNEMVFYQIGSILKKEQEYFVSIQPNDGEGFALFGPYDYYSFGNYVVEFRINYNDDVVDNDILDSTVAVLDVVTNAGQLVLAQKEVTLKDILTMQNIKLNFSVKLTSALEFRVFSFGIVPMIIGVKPKISLL